ncbi:Pvc16 family protein [Gloeothece verrucosa]|uniref:Pvc16 N-terminal domain-containing protein n=1 Tax=Gloeothece verrucosa (strain PCC 7822) TaxID=497965 RepID=E0UC24_GLOV7|nr:Pvc16 family protein [Gloeothece verrucosa]ADN16362.1 conserved hypothetical protein [Gloeothece verrucosa PCC 7822]
MITAVAQTLADLLTRDSSLLSTVQIDLSHPSKREDVRPALSLYLYDLRKSDDEGDLTAIERGEKDGHSNKLRQTRTNASVFWFDLSYMIIPWDWTNLGQQRLLSEVIQLLLSHSTVKENSLAPELQGYGDLSIRVASFIPDVPALWNALKLPLQPALYITIKTPFPIYCENPLSEYPDNQQETGFT